MVTFLNKNKPGSEPQQTELSFLLFVCLFNRLHTLPQNNMESAISFNPDLIWNKTQFKQTEIPFRLQIFD